MTGHHGAPSSGTAPRGPQRFAPVAVGTLSRRAVGTEGFEPTLGGLERPRSWPWTVRRPAVLPARRDRSCPPRTAGLRSHADPARTSTTGLWLAPARRSLGCGGMAAWQLRVVGFPSRVEGYMGPYDGRP